MNNIITSSRKSSQLFLNYVKKSLDIIPHIDQEVLISGDIKTSDIIQSYILYRDDYFHEKIFKPIILKESIKSEILSPGSGEISLLLSLLLLDDLLPKIISGNHYRESKDKLEKDCDDLINKINKASRILDKKSFDQIINQSFKEHKEREIIKAGINLSGSSRKIIVNKSNKNESSINVSDGYNFSISPDRNFLKKSWSRKNVNCLIIDGVILEVSEIHHLLTYASESNEPYVVFVRGLSPDVKNTIFVNNNRGTIDIMPVEIPISESTINIFSDLSAVCGCDITSSYKGDLISKASIEKISIIDSIRIDEKGVSIKNKSVEKRVLTQIQQILEKRSEILEPQNRVLFDERINALSSGKVEIKIGYNDQLKNPIVIESIDKFFRSIPNILKFGYIKRSNLFKSTSCETHVENHIYQILKSRKINHVSSHSLVCSIKSSLSIVGSILSTGCILPCNQS